MKINKLIVLVLIIVLALCFAACQDEDDGEGLGNIVVSGADTDPDPEPEPVIDEEPDDGVIVRQDEEGLVIVRIEDGVPEVFFENELWQRQHGIPDVKYGPFSVGNLTGRVADACIGKIETMDMPNHGNFVTPVIVFLMEDGTVDYSFADPYMGEYGNELYGTGGLPWLKNIKSLYFGPEPEGIWGDTIYAIDVDGLKYDIRRLYGFESVFSIRYMCDVEEMPGLSLFIKLEEDGVMWLEKYWSASEDTEYFKGKYEIFLAEGDVQEWPTGFIRFDYDYIDDSDRDQFTYMGVYSFSFDQGFYLIFDLEFSEPFSYNKEGAPVYRYEFIPMHFGYED